MYIIPQRYDITLDHPPTTTTPATTTDITHHRHHHPPPPQPPPPPPQQIQHPETYYITTIRQDLWPKDVQKQSPSMYLAANICAHNNNQRNV
jgi:hypothetical protein